VIPAPKSPLSAYPAKTSTEDAFIDRNRLLLSLPIKVSIRSRSHANENPTKRVTHTWVKLWLSF